MTAPTKAVMLENCEIAINTRLTGGAAESYSIDGRDIRYIPLPDLIKLRDQLRKEIAATGTTVSYATFKDPT